jgi:aspartyl-tRNA(Asn)/glutamyl-tRNA(Gln) amidotransferase subunit C
MEARMARGKPARSEITPQIFAHLVDLAALALEDDEREYLRRELNSQLKAIRELDAIEVDDDLPITSHGVPYSATSRPEIRKDVARPGDQADAILGQAPEVENRYLVVPDIPQEALE